MLPQKGDRQMEKIIIKKQEKKSKERRATVVVKPETYRKIYDLSLESNTPIEDITNMLLTEALKYVEIE